MRRVRGGRDVVASQRGRLQVDGSAPVGGTLQSNCRCAATTARATLSCLRVRPSNTQSNPWRTQQPSAHSLGGDLEGGGGSPLLRLVQDGLAVGVGGRRPCELDGLRGGGSQRTEGGVRKKRRFELFINEFILRERNRPLQLDASPRSSGLKHCAFGKALANTTTNTGSAQRDTRRTTHVRVPAGARTRTSRSTSTREREQAKEGNRWTSLHPGQPRPVGTAVTTQHIDASKHDHTSKHTLESLTVALDSHLGVSWKASQAGSVTSSPSTSR
jgi:hypothetical protein